MKLFLQINDIEKCIQRITKENLLLPKDLKEIYKDMTSISKSVCIDKLDDILMKSWHI